MYTSDSPSPRYDELIEQYTLMHKKKHFSGIGCYRNRPEIRRLVKETGSKTLLDYGCGRGIQIHENHTAKALFAKLGVFVENWAEALGVDSIVGYDPAVPQYAHRPLGTFDIVISIDVAEHIDEADLPWFVEDLFLYANKCVYMTVATVEANKSLPNGENCHVTLHPPEWWLGLIDEVAKKYPQVRYEVKFENGTDKD